MAARLLATTMFAVLTLVMAQAARAGEPAAWTVDDAVHRALENPEIEASLGAAIAASAAEVDEAVVRRTPDLGVDHEQVFGPPQVGYVQTTVMVRQSFDFTPWRRSLRKSVPHREAALRAEADQWTLEVATAVRLAFFQVRYHEDRIAALDAWIVRLDHSVAAIDKRRERGDVAPYEVRRVQREREIAVAHRAQEQARLAEAWAALEQWTPWSSQPRLTGQLPPSEVPTVDVATLPRIVELEQRKLVVGAELDTWGAPFGRNWMVGAGYRFARQGGSNGHGFMVSVSMPLTLWNTDRPRVERLRAERSQIEAELGLARTLAEQAEDATRTRLQGALEARANLPAPELDAELSVLAEAAYGAGEGTLLELLDAYESEASLRLSRIDLEWEARRAAIELQRRLGIGAQP